MNEHEEQCRELLWAVIGKTFIDLWIEKGC